jgi:hypothetical protein
VRRTFIVTANGPVARRRFATGFVIVALLLLTGTATALVAGTDTNTRSRGVVLFVGDSNVTFSAGQIMWRMTLQDHYNDAYIPVFAPRFAATIRTHDCARASGCTTYNYWQIRLHETLLKVQPDAIVNDLGINDALRPGTQTTPGYAFYGAKIDWFMRLIPRTTPVFWTNLACLIEPVDHWDGCKVVNKALAGARERWPNVVLVNWAASARSHPGYLVGANRSNVHLSAPGSSAWIALVTAAMDARLPAPD